MPELTVLRSNGTSSVSRVEKSMCVRELKAHMGEPTLSFVFAEQWAVAPRDALVGDTGFGAMRLEVKNGEAELLQAVRGMRLLADEDVSLGDYGVIDGAKVNVLCPSESIKLVILTLVGKTFHVEAASLDTVFDLKTKISQLEGANNIPPDQQKLIFQGTPLPDEGLLITYGIADGATVHFKLCVRAGMMHFTSGRMGLDAMLPWATPMGGPRVDISRALAARLRAAPSASAPRDLATSGDPFDPRDYCEPEHAVTAKKLGVGRHMVPGFVPRGRSRARYQVRLPDGTDATIEADVDEPISSFISRLQSGDTLPPDAPLASDVANVAGLSALLTTIGQRPAGARVGPLVGGMVGSEEAMTMLRPQQTATAEMLSSAAGGMHFWPQAQPTSKGFPIGLDSGLDAPTRVPRGVARTQHLPLPQRCGPGVPVPVRPAEVPPLPSQMLEAIERLAALSLGPASSQESPIPKPPPFDRP